MKKAHTIGLVGISAVIFIFSGVFAITRNADPYISELAFVEHSIAGIGSVVPASCESGYAHYGICLGPTINNVTIDSNPVSANGSSQYTITSYATYSDGSDHITDNFVLINYQGANAGQHRGYLGWSTGGFYSWSGIYKSAPIACAGGGLGAIYGGGYGQEYLNLISCSVSNSGQTQTVSFVVSFNTNFTSPLSSNTLSGFVYAPLGGTAWTPFNTFDILPASCALPWGGTLAHGNSVTAYQSSDVSLPTTCASPSMSESRTCTNGVLSGSYTSQSCTASCPVGTTWNGSGCVTLNGSLTVSPGTIPYNGTTTVTWNVTNAGTLSCSVSRSGGGSSWNGTNGSQVDTLTASRTYVLGCGGVPIDSKMVTVTIDPTLTVNRRIVDQGSGVNLTYDTNGQTCTLNGVGSVTGSAIATIPQVNAQTTFTLTCPIGTVSVTVEIIPIGFET